jgi:hypothetical protein
MGLKEKFYSWGTDGASDWAIGMSVASQLPGRTNGPADAFRHLLISAELNRVYPNHSGDWLLQGHESDFSYESDSQMDEYVNDVGARIGQFVRSLGGDTADVVHLVSKVMANSFPVRSWHGTKWVKVPGAGYKVSGAVPTRLPNGTALPPVVVAETDTKIWEKTNPEAFPGSRIPTGATNVPDRNWLSRFNYSGSNPTKALKYMLKNRPTGEPNPKLRGDHLIP